MHEIKSEIVGQSFAVVGQDFECVERISYIGKLLNVSSCPVSFFFIPFCGPSFETRSTDRVLETGFLGDQLE